MKRKRLFLNPLPSSPVLQRLPFKIILMVTSISINNVFIPVFLDPSTSKNIYFCPLWKTKNLAHWPSSLASFFSLPLSLSLLILCDYVLFFCRLPLYLKVICHQFYCIYLATPHSSQHLSSPTRDCTWGHDSESPEF